MADSITMQVRTNLPDLENAGVGHVVVLCKADHAASYIAYEGIVRLGAASHKLAPRQLEMKARSVQAAGIKLPYARAVAYFPALKKGQYREV